MSKYICARTGKRRMELGEKAGTCWLPIGVWKQVGLNESQCSLPAQFECLYCVEDVIEKEHRRE